MNKDEIDECIKVLRAGGIVVMPTDTIYGILGLALDGDVVSRIFEVKNRPGKLGTVLFADKEQLLAAGFLENVVEAAMQFWPGPTSVVLPTPQHLVHLQGEQASTAVRIPNVVWLRELLKLTGPLATTSANMPGKPPLTEIAEAKQLFGDRVDYYLDGGVIDGTKASRIVRLTDQGEIEVLRA